MLGLVVAVLGLAVVLPVADSRAGVQTSSTYRNPVIPADFPDPFVLPTHGVYAAYATNRDMNVQVMTSPDLVYWTLHGDAMPRLPNWAVPGRTWAPSVLELPGRYVMYFAAYNAPARVPCIGVAVSASLLGPFVSPWGSPLMCQPDRGGSIDPSVFRDDDGTPWLVWKSEGNPFGEPSRIWSQRLSGDGLGFVGPAAYLLRTDQPWEDGVVENPSMVRIGGRLHLFYSGNHWEGGGYAINDATCATPFGPCTKAAGPWLASGPAVAGPGGQEFMRFLDGTVLMTYHGWTPGQVGYPAGRRSLRVDRVEVSNGNPSVHATAQPTPLL